MRSRVKPRTARTGRCATGPKQSHPMKKAICQAPHLGERLRVPVPRLVWRHQQQQEPADLLLHDTAHRGKMSIHIYKTRATRFSASSTAIESAALPNFTHLRVSGKEPTARSWLQLAPGLRAGRGRRWPAAFAGRRSRCSSQVTAIRRIHDPVHARRGCTGHVVVLVTGTRMPLLQLLLLLLLLLLLQLPHHQLLVVLLSVLLLLLLKQLLLVLQVVLLELQLLLVLELLLLQALLLKQLRLLKQIMLLLLLLLLLQGKSVLVLRLLLLLLLLQ